MELQISNERYRVILNVIYRPPHGNFSLFSQEIERLTLESEMNEADEINLGDFNNWVDDIKSIDVQKFLRLLNNLAFSTS